MLDPGTVTVLLTQIRAQDGAGLDELVALIYDDCYQRAHRLRRDERNGHSLQTMDLVNEGLMRLLRFGEIERAANRGQLFWAYARAVRQVLVDHARNRNAKKREGDWVRVPVDDVIEQLEKQSHSTISDLDEALKALAEEFPQEAEVVEMHYFGGYTLSELAPALDVSLATIERRHRFAKAWLHDRLHASDE